MRYPKIASRYTNRLRKKIGRQADTAGSGTPVKTQEDRNVESGSGINMANHMARHGSLMEAGKRKGEFHESSQPLGWHRPAVICDQ